MQKRNKRTAGAQVTEREILRLEVIKARFKKESRSDVVRMALDEFFDRHPVTDEDLARVRLTGGASRSAVSGSATAPDNVVPIAEAPVLTRHTIVEESDGAGGIRTPSSFAGDTPPAALADALLPPDPLPLAA